MAVVCLTYSVHLHLLFLFWVCECVYLHKSVHVFAQVCRGKGQRWVFSSIILYLFKNEQTGTSTYSVCGCTLDSECGRTLDDESVAVTSQLAGASSPSIGGFQGQTQAVRRA